MVCHPANHRKLDVRRLEPPTVVYTNPKLPDGPAGWAIAIGLGAFWSVGFLYIAFTEMAHGNPGGALVGTLLSLPGIALAGATGWEVSRKRSGYSNVVRVSKDGHVEKLSGSIELTPELESAVKEALAEAKSAKGSGTAPSGIKVAHVADDAERERGPATEVPR
jgi:hypothetical protein